MTLEQITSTKSQLNSSFKDSARSAVRKILPQPEFIRIPRPSERDPIFSQTRSFWYSAEAKGLIRFKRFRLSGQRNGTTLIPVDEARQLIAKLTGEEQ